MKLSNDEIIVLRSMFSQLEQYGVKFDSEEWRLIERIREYRK